MESWAFVDDVLTVKYERRDFLKRRTLFVCMNKKKTKTFKSEVRIPEEICNTDYYHFIAFSYELHTKLSLQLTPHTERTSVRPKLQNPYLSSFR